MAIKSSKKNMLISLIALLTITSSVVLTLFINYDYNSITSKPNDSFDYQTWKETLLDKHSNEKHMKYKINKFINKKKSIDLFTNVNKQHIEDKIVFVYKNIDNNILLLLTETIKSIPAFKNIDDFLILPKYKLNKNDKELSIDVRWSKRNNIQNNYKVYYDQFNISIK